MPVNKLANATGIFNPNLLLVNLNNSPDRNAIVTEIRNVIKTADPDLEVFDFSGVVSQNTAFLASAWQAILLIPIFN